MSDDLIEKHFLDLVDSEDRQRALEDISAQISTEQYATLSSLLACDEKISEKPHFLDSSIRQEITDVSTAAGFQKVFSESAKEMIGGYQVLNKIAEHGQGIIYRANHPVLQRQVVIKLCKDQVSAHARESLINEGRILASLSNQHPNLAQIYDLQTNENGRLYLVMEFIEGRNLGELLEVEQFSVEESVSMIQQVCDAIEHVHSRGVLHKDLKPQNILITATDRQPKIIDFGLSVTRSAYTGNQNAETYGGTLYYMSPEQAAEMLATSSVETSVDFRSDLFSTGAILFEMLTGKRIYDLRSSRKDEIQSKIVACEIDLTPLDCPKIPKSVANACKKALEKDPLHRFQNVTDFKNALSGPQDASNITRAQPVDSSYRTIMFGTIVGLAVLLGLIWIARSFVGPSPQQDVTGKKQPDSKTGSSTKDSKISDSNKTSKAPSSQSNSLEFKLEVFGDAQTATHRVVFGDQARILVDLSEPAYCFLVAINPNGVTQLCYPEHEDLELALNQPVEQKLSTFEYPANQNFAFNFNDKVGQQTFILVKSDVPLPSFQEWNSGFEEVKNSFLTVKGKWKWNRGSVSVPMTRMVRGNPTEINGIGNFRQSVQRLVASYPEQEFQILSFPVEPAP